MVVHNKIYSLKSFSTGWIYYQINRTRHILENAFDTSVLQTMDHYTISKEELPEEETLEIDPYLMYRKSGIFQWVFDSLKFAYARRLVYVAKDSDKYFR